MSGIPNSVLQNIDKQTLRNLQQQVDEDTIRELLDVAIEERIVPHLRQIRSSAEQKPDHETIRSEFEDDPEDVQQENFDDAVTSVIEALFLLRQQPQEGGTLLKQLIRDPYVIEGLLLIFDNEQHIDPEYSAQIKEFAALHLHWAGVALMPEAYSPEEVREVAEELGLSVEHPEHTETTDTQPGGYQTGEGMVGNWNGDD